MAISMGRIFIYLEILDPLGQFWSSITQRGNKKTIISWCVKREFRSGTHLYIFIRHTLQTLTTDSACEYAAIKSFCLLSLIQSSMQKVTCVIIGFSVPHDDFYCCTDLHPLFFFFFCSVSSLLFRHFLALLHQLSVLTHILVCILHRWG